MKLFELEDEFIKNPNFENVTNYLGALNKIIYGINPYEKSKKIAIDYQDEETELQVQRSLEEDMEETLCGKPHNNGDDRVEGCSTGECISLKLNL